MGDLMIKYPLLVLSSLDRSIFMGQIKSRQMRYKCLCCCCCWCHCLHLTHFFLDGACAARGKCCAPPSLLLLLTSLFAEIANLIAHQINIKWLYHIIKKYFEQYILHLRKMSSCWAGSVYCCWCCGAHKNQNTKTTSKKRKMEAKT